MRAFAGFVLMCGLLVTWHTTRVSSRIVGSQIAPNVVTDWALIAQNTIAPTVFLGGQLAYVLPRLVALGLTGFRVTVGLGVVLNIGGGAPVHRHDSRRSPRRVTPAPTPRCSRRWPRGEDCAARLRDAGVAVTSAASLTSSTATSTRSGSAAARAKAMEAIAAAAAAGWLRRGLRPPPHEPSPSLAPGRSVALRNSRRSRWRSGERACRRGCRRCG